MFLMNKTKNYRESQSDYLKLLLDLSGTEVSHGSGQFEVAKNLAPILVADDDADMRGYIKGCLKADYSAFHIVEASNGKRAWDLLQQIEPALLILDLDMPVMSGFEVIENIQIHFKEWHTPVLVISGLDEIDAGFLLLEKIAVLKKPFDQQALLLKVFELLT